MHDQVAMGVLHRVTDVEEQSEAGLEIQASRVAPGGERLALHVLHGEVGTALGGGAPVEEPGDVGVLEAGQDLALASEALEHLVGVDAAAQQLERGALLERAVGPVGQVHHPHAPPTDLAIDPPGAHALTDEGARRLRLVRQVAHVGVERTVEDAAGRFRGGHQRQQFCAERRVVAGQPFGEGGPLRAGRLEKTVEQRLERLPAFGSQSGSPRTSTAVSS